MILGANDYETNWRDFALAALRWRWEGAYGIWIDDDVWMAKRLDNGYTMTAATPDELTGHIFGDCTARPVHFDPA